MEYLQRQRSRIVFRKYVNEEKMIILKIATVTALLYVGLAAALDIAVTIIGRTKEGGFGLYFTSWGWYVLFGLLWIASFSVAKRIVLASLLTHAK